MILMNFFFRSATYLRLLPRDARTQEGRRHINSVPVKLTKPEGNLHRSHVDGEFAAASIRSLETLASILGPAEVFFLSQDDKARVPIGITAANKQTPMLMHMEYKVTLPDHDWVVAQRHKLIPSVYAGIKINEGAIGKPEAVTYSGPTYVAVRSGKHCSSTANTHAKDFEEILKLEEFKTFSKTEEGFVKPVVIITSDGGPDENPRYKKVIGFAIQHFKRHNLDAIFICTNAPGRSAFNRVERRMAPLSHELAGLILPYDQYGSHLNNKGETIDLELEKRNFEFAGKTLAEIWGTLTIDSYDVVAKYVTAHENLDDPEEECRIWYSNHVQESQYLLQIVKCSDTTCCTPARSSIKKLLPNGFLPPPIKLTQTKSGLQVVETVDSNAKFTDLLARLTIKVEPETKQFLKIPYDWSCPSVKGKLANRSCKKCGAYHASKKSLNAHIKNLHKGGDINVITKKQPLRIAARRAKELMCVWKNDLTGDEEAEWVSEDEIDVDSLKKNEKLLGNPRVIVKKLEDWLTIPWETLKV